MLISANFLLKFLVTPKKLIKTIQNNQKAGFSLIITITLMILLTLLALGILNLSATTLRGTNNESARQEAENNARLALSLAIGELQRKLGSDRAVSAPADAIVQNAAQPHLVGAWESWSWDPVTDQQSPNYQAEKRDRFLGWLASRSQDPAGNDSLAYAATELSGDTVQMVGNGSANSTAGGNQTIAAELVTLQDRDGNLDGGYAWSVLSESTKARINLFRDENRVQNGESLAASLTFPERFGRQPFGLTGFQPTQESDWSKLVSNLSIDVASGQTNATSVARENFFDFTTSSQGVLSNVAEGGLKQDLTTILENELLNGTRVYSGTAAPFGPVDPHWSYLADYYNQFKRFQGADATRPTDVTQNIIVPNVDENDSSPPNLTLRPVLAKLQIVFSMVTHEAELEARGGFPAALRRYAAANAGPLFKPWVVFDPIITLWNPYSVPIQFDGLSVGLDKIPVGFRFEKTVGPGPFVELRNPENQRNVRNRSFWPLSHMVASANQQDAITNLIFDIRGGNAAEGATREPIVLQPGENKVFSILVDEGSGVASNPDLFITETEQLNAANSILSGVTMVEGLNLVGGLRVDHFAKNQNNRNQASLHDFEQVEQNARSWQYAVMRPDDLVKVRMKIANNDAQTDQEEENGQDFTMNVEVNQLGQIQRGRTMGNSFTVRDKERLYPEEDREPGLIIEREFATQEIFQSGNDPTRGGKTPFAVLSMNAKSTQDLVSQTKGWLFGNPVLPAYVQDENEAPQALQSYEFSFRQISSPNSFPMVETDPANNRGYFGPGQGAQNGLTATPMFSLPTHPMVSIGQFQGANLSSAVKPPFFNYPLGNSYAHPLIAPERVVAGTFSDHSYLLNQRLWDDYYFSGLTERTGNTNRDSLEAFFNDRESLTPRLQPYLTDGQRADELIEQLSSDPERTSREVAASQMIQGPFNIHSTSVKAWTALLLSNFEAEVPSRDNNTIAIADASPYARLLPTYSEDLQDLAQSAGSGDVGGNAITRARRWLGALELTEEQAGLLANEIVNQIRERCAEDGGPFLSMGEFVNRKVGPSSVAFTNKGVLQTAIDLANGTDQFSAPGQGGDGELFTLEDGVGITDIPASIANQAAMEGNSAEGAPGTLIQGDLLQHLGSILTVRDDTFRIRAYGRSTSRSGATEAEVWCEAVVQRFPEFLDDTQSPGTPFAQLNSTNATFGRQFRLVSFRWLGNDEV